MESSATLVVLLGTVLSLLLSFPPRALCRAMGSVSQILYRDSVSPDDLVRDILACSKTLKVKGCAGNDAAELLARVQDRSLQKALILLTDGMPFPEIARIIESDIRVLSEIREQDASVFATAAGYAPTLGVLGSVLSLSAALRQLDDFTALGAGVSAAFMGTACGLVVSNLLLAPISEKLTILGKLDTLRQQLIYAGVEAIAAGLHPEHVAMKLDALCIALGSRGATVHLSPVSPLTSDGILSKPSGRASAAS